MSNKTGKLKRLLMAVGLSMLSICTLNQVVNAELSDEVVKYRKTGLKNSMIRYQLELPAGESVSGLYLGASNTGNALSTTADASGNKIYLQSTVDTKSVIVIEVKSTEKKLTIVHGDATDTIDIGAGKGLLENSGPVVNWICCGTHVGESAEQVELNVNDVTYIDKIVALNATVVDGVITPEEGTTQAPLDPELAAVGGGDLFKADAWKKEDIFRYLTSKIPNKSSDPDVKANCIRIYDILGNYTDVEAPTGNVGTCGPKITWAYKSEDKIWTSTPNKSENKVDYTSEEVNYIQFGAYDPNAIIVKLVDQNGNDRVLIDEMLQQNVITAKYRFKPNERYFFVENYFGWRTMVKLDTVDKDGKLVTFPKADGEEVTGYVSGDRDQLVDVSYGVAAKNADGSHVAISVIIPSNKELISINTEEDVDISEEKAQAETTVKDSPAVWTSKHEGETRRGNERLVATYVGVPSGTTHVDVMYGTRTTTALAANENASRTEAITPDDFKTLKNDEKIKISGNFDMNEIEYDEKVVVELTDNTVLPEITSTPELYAKPEYKVKVPVVDRAQSATDEEYSTACIVEFKTLVGAESGYPYTNPGDARYIAHSENDLRVIVPLGENETFAGLQPYEKVVLPYDGDINDLSDQEKVKVEKVASADVFTGYKKINRDKEHVYRTNCKYDITHKYDVKWKYDLTHKYDPTHKWDMYNKLDTANKYGVGAQTGAKEIPVALDLDLVAPKVVLRNTGAEQDGDISDASEPSGDVKYRVYKNRETNPTQAIIEVTDVVSGIAKIVAVVSDPEADVIMAQKKIDAINAAKSEVEAKEEALTTAVVAVDNNKTWDNADDVLGTAVSNLRIAVGDLTQMIYSVEDVQAAIDDAQEKKGTLDVSTQSGEISAIEGAITAVSNIITAQEELATAQTKLQEKLGTYDSVEAAVAALEQEKTTAQGAFDNTLTAVEQRLADAKAAKEEAKEELTEAVQALGGDYAESTYESAEGALGAAQTAAQTAAGISTEDTYDGVVVSGKITEVKADAVTKAKVVVPECEDYNGVPDALDTARSRLTEAVRSIGGAYVTSNYTRAYDDPADPNDITAVVASRVAIKNAIATAHATYDTEINDAITTAGYQNINEANAAIDGESIIGDGAYAIATAAANALAGNTQAANCKKAIEDAVTRAIALDVAKKNVDDIVDAVEKVDNIVTAKAKVDAITTAKDKKETAETNITTETNARNTLIEAEKAAAGRHELIDVRGLPKSVVQLISLPVGAKYINIYDGIGNCQTVVISDVTKINGNNFEAGDEANNNTGLALSFVLDADVDDTHIVEADYRSATVGMKSFVRAADEVAAAKQHVTPVRETMYGEKEFVKNEAYDYDDEDTFKYLYETLQTSEDIAKFYPVAPQVSDMKGAQLQGEPYCWAVDVFGNVAKCDLNKLLFKGNEDPDHYVMMDKNDDVTTAISVKVEDLRRVKKIAAIIDEEEVTLETFEVGDAPSATGTGPEDVDRVYEIGEGIVGDVIIYHTNDKTVLTDHQNVETPVAVSDSVDVRKDYVQLKETTTANQYKAIIKYGIKRIDYSDGTVIEFYDEIPKDVDVYLRGSSPASVTITDALGYEYTINEGDQASDTTKDLGKYPVHQA